MKATQILLLSVASLLMLAGCGKKNSTGKSEENITDAHEKFTMTITGYEFSSTITAQSLTIDWGDGTIETFEACDNRSIQHIYKESEPHIATAKAENLTKLEISGGPLSDEGAKITNLDVSRCTHLIHLDCSSNQLKSLDVSKNGNLITLWCNSNQLTGLNLSENPELSELNCRTNQLTNLDVSKNPKLKTVDCGNNELSAKMINAIFHDLPVNLCGRIDFTRNEGNDQTCDAFIAEKKGWRVIFYENYGSFEVELIAREQELDLQLRAPDFQDFIKKFFLNEDNYQLSHIQFPLPSNVSDVDLERKDWCSIGWGHVLEGEIGDGNITYRGTFEEYYGVRYIYNFYNGDNLIYVLIFEKINGQWMMIEFRLGED
jgi:hypothetical protein